jgi:hypothetical protein
LLKKISIFFFLFFSILQADIAGKYIQKSENLQLSKTKYWNSLLHAVNGVSEIDGGNFFLSKNGKTDQKSELHATIKGLYSKFESDENSTYCRFPARTNWLIKKLNMKDVYVYDCKEYKRLLKEVDPTSATIVFPAAHVNSPASMFGHTFIRIDSRYNSKLVSYAINYAASANQDTENGVLFAIKGLFGGYYGAYSLLPYYEKLKEYRDAEQRDIWEYSLNLTKEEMIRMFMHIWEIKDSLSYYYFFDENCSYNMLWLIEIARESVDLRKYFFYQVIPIETVFAMREENLIEKSSYRPSKRTKLLYYDSVLNDNLSKYAILMAKGEKSPTKIENDNSITKQNKILTLNAALELNEYYFSKRIIDKKNYLTSNRGIAISRSKFGVGKDIEFKTPANPLKTHRSKRVSVGHRYSSIDKHNDILLNLRATYHNLFDSDIGLLRGTQIEFGNLILKNSYDTKSLSVDEFTLVSINSYTPMSRFFTPISWRMHLGATRYGFDNNLTATLSVGAGRTFNFSGGYMYGLVDPSFYYDKNRYFSIGASLGVVMYAKPYLKYHLEFTQKLWNDKKTQKNIILTQNLNIKHNIDVNFNYEFIERFTQDEHRASLLLNYFY